MPDTIAHFFLIFSNLIFIGPLIIIGYIGIDRRFFFELTGLLLLSITINVALKITFHIPLSEALKQPGFAFPSGHMQLATVFYGYLILALYNTTLTYKKVLIIMLTGVLAGVGCGLIHFGYHNFLDVIGGAITALLLIGMYKLTCQRVPKLINELLLILATLAMLYNYIRYPQLPFHAWCAYLTLIGLSVGEKSFKTLPVLLNLPQKSLAALSFIVLALVIYLSSKNTMVATFVLYPQWFLFGFLLPASCQAASKMLATPINKT